MKKVVTLISLIFFGALSDHHDFSVYLYDSRGTDDL